MVEVVMRLAIAILALLLVAACSLFEPAGRRFVVFFQGSSAEIDGAADSVIVSAAHWAKDHPNMPVTVLSFTDPYGSTQANADFARLRAQVVIDKLMANGVGKSIDRREIGSVDFQLSSQESRRVEVIVGRP